MNKGRSRRIPGTVDEYLADVPGEAKRALKKLRRAVRASAPNAMETISYQIPTFKQNGMLIAFAAFTNHCSIFPATKVIKTKFRNELKKFDIKGSTIRFLPEKPLPDTLIKKIVKARLSENELRMKKRAR
jgi:uncharacterized protein YdhG (YjbR/CyaY superfamily)